MKKILVILLLMLMVTTAAVAQGLSQERAKPTKAKKQRVEPSFAWSVSEPLGLHYPSTIDTIHLDYHRTMVPSMVSDAWATTGNYGAPGQDQIFFNRPLTGEFFFEDAIGAWMHNTSTMRYYNTRIPMTLLSHSTGGDKQSNLDRTQFEFSGNVDRKTQAGGAFDYIYSKGSYDVQADKDFTWRLFGSHMGDRYEMQAFFNHYNYTTKESGGITDDRYITDPAEVQGGVTRVDNKSIPTLLSNAHSHLEGSQLYLNQRYKVGFYRYRRDSVTDTIIDRTYVPVTSFIWTLDFKHAKHQFLNSDGYEDTTYFDHTYLHLGGTDESTRYWRLRNTVGLSMLEGFNKYAKFGFAIYGTHEVRRYTQAIDTVTGTTLPSGLEVLPVSVPHSKTQNLLWLGGQLTKQQGSLLRYNATAQFGVLGDAAGEIDITGDVTTRFKMLGDSVSITGYGYFKNLSVPYLLQNYISNHYAWHNSFSKTKRVRIGGELDIPFTWTNANVGYETLNDYIYWNQDGLPAQHTGAIHVLSARIRQGLHFKAFNWENSLTLQTCSNEQVLPLPKFAIYSNMYATFTIARVLHVQLGVDGNYYTKYYAPAYDPATMTFHSQHAQECGNFAIMNLYGNFKMKQARFFIAWTHFNQKITSGSAYFATPHYPLNPARLQIGVSVNFVN
ncbi:MAG: putative porin [Muribaculaceae bacterium]|nr:putative porin [Muribaculaceae bacterium]